MNRLNANSTFWRAVHSLAHPVSLLAIVLLLFNDHWLRYHYPSWFTGKLGDFTWLIFAPFIAALFFALLPRPRAFFSPLLREACGRGAGGEGILAFAFIGLWFALAKTVPFVHHLTTETLYAIVGWRGTLRMDVTDLLTLPALFIGWHIWRNAPDTPLSLRPLAYVAFGLGIVGTVASDSYTFYDPGITEICAYEGALYTATANYGDTFQTNVSDFDWVSRDGGLTWSNTTPLPEDATLMCNTEAQLVDLTNPQIQYRWMVNELIERSTDGGQTWRTDYELKYLQQDVRAYLYHRQYDEEYEGRNLELEPVPAGGIVDKASGNVVFAMGWYGVLVRQPSGLYEWVSIGLYGIENLLDKNRIQSALFYELWLAAMLPFLIITTSAAYMRRRSGILLRGLWLIIGWGGWILLSIYLLPADKASLSGSTLTSDWYFVGLISLVLLVIVAFPLSIGAVTDITRNFSDAWKPLLLAGIGTGLLYILPLLAWSQGSIPLYTTANIFALLLAACGVLASAHFLHRRLPDTPRPRKKKKKPPTKDKRGGFNFDFD